MYKPVLCIVPGWGGTQDTWRDFIEEAQKFFIVHCIELPGFGGVTTPRSVWGVEQYGEYVYHQLIEIKREHQKEKIILLGHSFGGQVATYIAAWHGDMFDELVLVAAAVVRPERKIKRLIFGTLIKTAKKILRIKEENTKISEIKRKIYSAVFATDYVDTSGIKREIFKKVIREDMQSLLPKITKHTLIFWGVHDAHTPLRHGKKIAKQLNGSELIIFSNGKHGLHHTHKTEIIEKLKQQYTKE